jgi:hypothetical protein
MINRRIPWPRRATAAVAITTGLTLAVAGCGGGDGGDGGDRKSATSEGAHTGGTGGNGGGDGSGGSGGSGGHSTLAQVKGGKDGRLTLTVTSAVRDHAGFATLKGTVRNDGPAVAVLPGWASDEAELKDNGLSMAGATLVDEKARKRYFILRDTAGRCLCTRFSGGFQQGETTHWYAQFPAPPDSTTEVDFQVADLPSATVELSSE